MPPLSNVKPSSNFLGRLTNREAAMATQGQHGLITRTWSPSRARPGARGVVFGAHLGWSGLAIGRRSKLIRNGQFQVARWAINWRPAPNLAGAISRMFVSYAGLNGTDAQLLRGGKRLIEIMASNHHNTQGSSNHQIGKLKISAGRGEQPVSISASLARQWLVSRRHHHDHLASWWQLAGMKYGCEGHCFLQRSIEDWSSSQDNQSGQRNDRAHQLGVATSATNYLLTMHNQLVLGIAMATCSRSSSRHYYYARLCAEVG